MTGHTTGRRLLLVTSHHWPQVITGAIGWFLGDLNQVTLDLVLLATVRRESDNHLTTWPSTKLARSEASRRDKKDLRLSVMAQLYRRVQQSRVWRDLSMRTAPTEARKIAVMADSFELPIAPHTAGGPLLLADFDPDAYGYRPKRSAQGISPG